jgi:hypothetical protein
VFVAGPGSPARNALLALKRQLETKPKPSRADRSRRKEEHNMSEKVNDRSSEYAKLVRDAEVGADAPETTPEKPGNLSGGEQNNRPVRG